MQHNLPRVRQKLKSGTGLVVIRLRGWDNDTQAATANLGVFSKEVFLRDLNSFGIPMSAHSRPTNKRPLSSASQSSLELGKMDEENVEYDPVIIPWESWSSEVTRFITDRRFVTARGVTSSCDGFRLVVMSSGDESPFGSYSGKISILDFNPDTVNWALSTVGQQSEPSFTREKGYVPVELDPEWEGGLHAPWSNSHEEKEPFRIRKRVVTQTDVIDAQALFKVSVESTLPFYEVMQGVRSAGVCELRVDQDRLYIAVSYIYQHLEAPHSYIFISRNELGKMLASSSIVSRPPTNFFGTFISRILRCFASSLFFVYCLLVIH